jgi:hypothetical protein
MRIRIQNTAKDIGTKLIFDIIFALLESDPCGSGSKTPLKASVLDPGSALVPDTYAQCTHQFLTRMLSSAPVSVPDAFAQRSHQFLMRMLSACISSFPAC